MSKEYTFMETFEHDEDGWQVHLAVSFYHQPYEAPSMDGPGVDEDIYDIEALDSDGADYYLDFQREVEDACWEHLQKQNEMMDIAREVYQDYLRETR